MGKKSKAKKRTKRGEHKGSPPPRESAEQAPQAPSPASEPARPLPWGPLGAILVLTALAYANALDNPFVYDDFRTVVNNPSLAEEASLGQVLTHDRFRPLVNLSYALDRAVWGKGPHGFHLTSLALHLLNVVLLFLVARRLLGATVPPDPPTDRTAPLAGSSAEGWALLVAGLYAVHPLLTEGVGYITGRSEVLCASFLLGSLGCLLRAYASPARRWAWAAVGVVLWIGSLATKEVGAALPFLLLVYHFTWHSTLRDAERRAGQRGMLWLALGLVVLTLCGGALRVSSYLTAETSWTDEVFLRNLLTQGRVIWRYLQLLVLPAGQSLAHRVVEGDALALRGALAGGLLLALAGLAWWRRRQLPLLCLGWLWFLLALMPTTLVPLNEAMSEHRVYGAVPGFLLVLVALLQLAHGRLAGRLDPQRTRGRALAAAVLVLLAGLTFARNRVWDDPVTLWKDAVAKSPGVYAPLRSLADTYRMTKRCAEAVPVYREALELAPDSHDARNLLGACLVRTEDYDEARREFERVVAGHPTNLEALNNLGMLAVIQGKKTIARSYFERALMVDPASATAKQGLKLVAQ